LTHADAATTGTGELVVVRDVTLPLDPAIMSDRMIGVLRSGRYERSEAIALDAVVRRGDRILELGGGIGFISTYAAKRGATVTTVEANPDLIPLIERTHSLNGVSGTVLHGAATGSPRKVEFWLVPDFWASSTVHGKGRAVTVDGLAIDDLCRRFRPDVLIVDIEGGEADVFTAADLTGVRHIVIEMHPAFIGEEAVGRVRKSIRDRGFHRQAVKGSHAEVFVRRRFPKLHDYARRALRWLRGRQR
jgi:FkbM family methyltransferase